MAVLLILSIFIGFGIMGLRNSWREYRVGKHQIWLPQLVFFKDFNTFIVQGHSWSIGGDPDAQTVATFLRFYTPNIVGASLGNKTIEVILT